MVVGIQGPTLLHGGIYKIPTDIRAGVAMVIAGLVATGETRLSNIHELQRKYDKLVEKLTALGGDLEIVS